MCACERSETTRVWLYARLSRDEDDELNSLTNQQNIIREYAEKNNYTVVGESFDDNVSGMHFNREGINKIYEAVENKLIDAVIVKDMSRFGRHKTQTALFIDYLRENDVKVLSVTGNLDTSNENDECLKTPAYYQLKYLDKHQGYNKPEITTRYLWNGTAVKRVLTNEFYCGNLVNHKYMLDKINRQRKTYSADELNKFFSAC